MLEEKLEALNAKMDALIAAMESLTVAVYTQPVRVDPEEDLPVVGKAADRIKAVAEETKPKKAEPKEEAAPEQPDLADAPISRDDLQDLCMTIVRADRTKKDAIKKTIASFAGAATLKEVPDADLAELKTKLGALKWQHTRN